MRHNTVNCFGLCAMRDPQGSIQDFGSFVALCTKLLHRIEAKRFKRAPFASNKI